MTIIITLRTDNAAFEDSRGHEEARIIIEAAEFTRTALECEALGPRYQRTLRDVNGNAVGALVIEDTEAANA
jgi:hypothetical protein